MLYSYSTLCCRISIYPCRKHAFANVRASKLTIGFCFAVLCCGYTLTDFPISIRLTSLALWQSNDCPSASKATLMNMDKYFMWIHYERLHNHKKQSTTKPCAYFLGYTVWQVQPKSAYTCILSLGRSYYMAVKAWPTLPLHVLFLYMLKPWRHSRDCKYHTVGWFYTISTHNPMYVAAGIISTCYGSCTM